MELLECAEAVSADYLVSGDGSHVPDRWKKTAVIHARELIEIPIKKC